MPAKLYSLLRRYRFRILIISINLLIGIVPLVLSIIIINNVYMKNVVRSVENDVNKTFLQINREFNEYFDNINMLSKTFFINTQFTQCFKEDPELKEIKSAFLLRDMFNSALQSEPSIKGIITVANNGNNVGILNAKENISFDKKDIQVFENEIALNPNKGLVFVISDKEGEKPVNVYAIRRIKSLYNFENIAWGIIILDKSDILSVIEDVFNNKNMHIQLSNNGVSIQIYPTDYHFPKEVIDKAYTITDKNIFTLDGNKFILRKGIINRVGWEITAITQVDSLIDEWLIIPISILALILTILLVSIFASILFNYMISQPLSQLVRAIKHVSMGNLKYRIDWQDKGGEFTDVIKAFNNMAKEISELTGSVIHSQKQLYQMKINKTDAELRALQMQINSHYVSNSLNGIRGMIKSNKLEIADISIQKLVAVFRYAAKYEEYVSFAQEANCIQNYLELQEIRFKNCLLYKMELEKDLWEYRVLKMLFQPVIENSIMHGFKKGCRLVIKICAFKKDEKLIVKILDNGIGMSPEKLEIINTRLASVDSYGNSLDTNNLGIMNIQRRIKAFFGSQYGISIKSFERRGTIVRYEIPLLKGVIYE